MPRYFSKTSLFTLLLFSSFSISSFAEQEFSTRIVGGQESQPDEWPWIVSVKSAIKLEHVCGGSLIADKWILTAAHCVIYKGRVISPLQLSATIGEYDLSRDSSNVTIDQIFVHPDYNSENQLNDIALLKLANPVNNVPLTIASSQVTTDAIANQNDVSALGWGSTTANNPGEIVAAQQPDILRHVKMPLMTDAMCSNYLSDQYRSPEMLCAGLIEGGLDSCQGDSGGPLVIEQDGEWQQLGIVSWGYGCAAAGYPGVYARTSNYSEWVNNIIEGINATSKLEFNDIELNNDGIQNIEISNNANTDVNLTIKQQGSAVFSIDNRDCNFISAYGSCTLAVSYLPTDSLVAEGLITISSDLHDAPVLYSQLIGLPLINAMDIASSAGFDTNNITWFSGGFSPWQFDQSTSDLKSGSILNDQKSILKAQINGSGTLNFAWAVDSEANYDFLALIINGQQVGNISASKNLQAKQFFLQKEQNTVIWIYEKDQSESTGADQAYLNNLTFTPMGINAESNTSGGGSLNWLS
ncbi:MAG: trypsin-like serine protease, partial [Psychromonas sp.]